MGWRRNKKTDTVKNSRINIVMAIVFIFGAYLILTLFKLQIFQKDDYMALADSQHSSTKMLEPERGRIFISDKTDAGKGGYYPLATNKDFAVVYAVPAEIEDPESAARRIFFIFDREKEYKMIDKKFQKLLEEMKAKASTTENRLLTKEEIEELEEDKEDEKKKRRDEIVKKYREKFSDKKDKYERISAKVDEPELKKMHALLEAEPDIFMPDDEGRDKAVSADISPYVFKNEVMYKIDGSTGEETKVKLPGFGYTMKTYRYYPEKNISSHITGFVGYEGDQVKGNYGLEEFFDDELKGISGSVTAGRGAGGSLIIVNEREYLKPIDGSDLILTIDRSIQFTACQKLNEAVKRHGADSGSVIVLEPKTGAVLAMCASPDFDPNNYQDVGKIYDFNNLAIFDQYEPGSIFKVITMAMGLDQGKVLPETTYEDTGVVTIAGHDIRNSDRKANGVQTMTEVLEKSLNTGVVHVVKQIGLPAFKDYVEKFGFGERTGIELGGEAKGYVGNLNDKLNKEFYSYTASFGQGISATPLQMVSAFNSIANGGVIMKPYIVKEIVRENGDKAETRPQTVRQVISEKTANLLGAMMVNVIENGHGQKAGVPGYYIAGKTGTAQVPRKDGRGYEAGAHIGSFAGFGPVENPVFTMIVRIDNPRDVEWAESSAAPLFGEIAKFILDYRQVAPTRKVDEK